VRTSRVEYKVSVSGISRERLFSLFNIDNIPIDRSRSTERACVSNNYLVLPIKSISKCSYKGKLVDIQVANTNDFVAENVIVHNSWLESMAAKIPVLMPANTMLPEFITEDIGWLCKSGSNPSLWTVIQFDNEVQRPLVDVDDMVKQLVEIYDNRDEARRRAENAYKWIHEKMDWQNCIVPNYWVKLFDEAVKNLGVEELTKSSEVESLVEQSDKRSIKTEVF